MTRLRLTIIAIPTVIAGMIVGIVRHYGVQDESKRCFENVRSSLRDHDDSDYPWYTNRPTMLVEYDGDVQLRHHRVLEAEISVAGDVVILDFIQERAIFVRTRLSSIALSNLASQVDSLIASGEAQFVKKPIGAGHGRLLFLRPSNRMAWRINKDGLAKDESAKFVAYLDRLLADCLVIATGK